MVQAVSGCSPQSPHETLSSRWDAGAVVWALPNVSPALAIVISGTHAALQHAENYMDGDLDISCGSVQLVAGCLGASINACEQVWHSGRILTFCIRWTAMCSRASEIIIGMTVA